MLKRLENMEKNFSFFVIFDKKPVINSGIKRMIDNASKTIAKGIVILDVLNFGNKFSFVLFIIYYNIFNYLF